MLIRQGADRTFTVDRRLAWSLAAIAGSLNTVAFQELGFFSANMTGNVSLLSIHLADADWNNSLLFLLIVAMFIAGAAFSTMLILTGLRRGHGGVYAYAILIEAVLLALLGCAELWLPAAHRAFNLILGLSFLMGLQNAVVTQISQARVRTTHVSGMATDIGIELARLVEMRRRGERGEDYSRVDMALRLHTETVLAFLGGGIAGIVVHRFAGNAILLIAAALLGSLSLTGLWQLKARARAA